MSKPGIHLIIKLHILLLLVQIHFSVFAGGSNFEDSAIDALLERGCTQKIGECDEEAEMESEISRRVLLMQKRYISYETLRRDMVPCAKPGASYYACHAGQANSYSRGCEVITRCARG
ncbi:hypothetical protein HS088_TW01G00435 [Tripterygium wilfordii]|uniref:Protein RALF-like 24 n=1 Tax=Tripterygium wilfordii TaxID=458696 RepID=A0A7J7E1K0_TRIWF|nr:protein RALF-like 24 [Tripterygium wilfordii]KAF5752520.1 hypothetical protein HS088_TW01G00435 [Tripterygium wilfordii]